MGGSLSKFKLIKSKRQRLLTKGKFASNDKYAVKKMQQT